MQRAGRQIVAPSAPPASTRRGTTSKPSGQCRGWISSRRTRNKQCSAAHWRKKSCEVLGQLANTCNRIRSLCKQGTFKTTEHKIIMGYLEKGQIDSGRMDGWEEKIWRKSLRSFERRKATRAQRRELQMPMHQNMRQ